MSSFLWILALSLHVRAFSCISLMICFCIFLSQKHLIFLSSFPFLGIKMQMVTHVGPVVCIFIAILLQYFTLTNFCWMLVEGKFLTWHFKVFSRFLLYSNMHFYFFKQLSQYVHTKGLYLYMLVVETFSGDNLRFGMYAFIGWGEFTYLKQFPVRGYDKLVYL